MPQWDRKKNIHPDVWIADNNSIIEPPPSLGNVTFMSSASYSSLSRTKDHEMQYFSTPACSCPSVLPYCFILPLDFPWQLLNIMTLAVLQGSATVLVFITIKLISISWVRICVPPILHGKISLQPFLKIYYYYYY